jgi:hypothetical protein
MAEIAYDEEFFKLLPSKWWANFFKKFKQIETVPNSEWKPIHHLAYFCKRYGEHYGQRMSFSLAGRPGNCQELFKIKKVIAVLGTSNQRTIREYIDWVFDYKIIPGNLKVHSISFIANVNWCNEFKTSLKERAIIARTTALPVEYSAVVLMLDLPIKTFGDLAFAKQALDLNPDDPSKQIYDVMFTKLYQVGFEFSVLDNLR